MKPGMKASALYWVMAPLFLYAGISYAIIHDWTVVLWIGVAVVWWVIAQRTMYSWEKQQQVIQRLRMNSYLYGGDR